MPKPIPRSELRVGALKCLEVAASRLDEAAALIRAGFLSQAGVIFSFAIEEFGKATLLRNAYSTGSDPVVVKGLDDDHKTKMNEAAKVIPAKYLLLTKADFDPDEFAPGDFHTGTQVDVKARLNGLYVDWDGAAWRYGVNVDGEALEESINGVRSALTVAATASWPP
jgi:AbiV family abortive infection protein